jgi:long-chain fatty acid transport protein
LGDLGREAKIPIREAASMTGTARIACAVVLLCIGVAGRASAGGFTNNAIGSRAYAMAVAFTAVADDASAVYFNPAGLALIDDQTWQADVYASATFTDFDYSRQGITDESNETFFLPGFFVAKTASPWAFGLGFYTPWAGGGTIYENFQHSGSDRESQAGLTALTPAVAYRLRPNLAVGAGVSGYYGVMKSTYPVCDPDSATCQNVRTKYDGLAGYSGHIGIMYKPLDVLSVGVCVRSKFPVDMDGYMKVAGSKHSSDVSYDLPPVSTLGLAYRPWLATIISLEASYFSYGATDQIRFKTSGLPDISAPTHYKDTWDVRLGAEYEVRDDLRLRAGFLYSEAPTKREGLNPDSNDVDMLIPTIGVGYQMTQAVGLNLTGVYTHGLERKYNGQTFNQEHFVIAIGCTYKFWGQAPPDERET